MAVNFVVNRITIPCMEKMPYLQPKKYLRQQELSNILVLVSVQIHVPLEFTKNSTQTCSNDITNMTPYLQEVSLVIIYHF